MAKKGIKKWNDVFGLEWYNCGWQDCFGGCGAGCAVSCESGCGGVCDDSCLYTAIAGCSDCWSYAEIDASLSLK
jgi:hypothetical protein